jgi:hypothetical protein
MDISQAPDAQQLALELATVAKRGIWRVQQSEIPILASLKQIQKGIRHSAGSDFSGALRTVLKDAAYELGNPEELLWLFGLHEGIAAWPSKQLRSRAAEAMGVTVETFNRRRLVPLLKALTSAVLDLETQHLLAASAQVPGTEVPGQSRGTVPGDASEFVRDVTIADGTIFEPGEEFEKAWELRNVGTVPWRGRRLMRLGATEGPTLQGSPSLVPIPDTEPGETVQIRVPMKAPLVVGTTRSTWKMVDSDGNLCFPDRYFYGVYCEIIVMKRHRRGKES